MLLTLSISSCLPGPYPLMRPNSFCLKFPQHWEIEVSICCNSTFCLLERERERSNISILKCLALKCLEARNLGMDFFLWASICNSDNGRRIAFIIIFSNITEREGSIISAYFHELKLQSCRLACTLLYVPRFFISIFSNLTSKLKLQSRYAQNTKRPQNCSDLPLESSCFGDLGWTHFLAPSNSAWNSASDGPISIPKVQL